MRWQDVGLVVLGLVAAALAFLTFRAVGSVPSGAPADSSTFSPEPLSTDLAPGTSTSDPAGATSGPDAADTTAGPSPSRVSSVQDLLQSEDPLVITVLGDSTGNETWEWTYLWAGMLAESRTVTIAAWNAWTEDGYVEPTELSSAGTGEAGPVMIWNGQQSGASASYPVGRLDDLLPEPPDLVILNYGHNNTVEDVDEQLGATLEALRAEVGEDLPVLVTLQQPQAGDANAAVREAVHAFAVDHDLGVIDVAAAFEETGDPDALLVDAVHPGEVGSQLWAETVAATLRAP